MFLPGGGRLQTTNKSRERGTYVASQRAPWTHWGRCFILVSCLLSSHDRLPGPFSARAEGMWQAKRPCKPIVAGIAFVGSVCLVRSCVAPGPSWLELQVSGNRKAPLAYWFRVVYWEEVRSIGAWFVQTAAWASVAACVFMASSEAFWRRAARDVLQ